MEVSLGIRSTLCRILGAIRNKITRTVGETDGMRYFDGNSIFNLVKQNSERVIHEQ